MSDTDIQSEPFTKLEQETAYQLAIQHVWAQVAKHVQGFRERHSLSLDEFSKRIGSSKSQVSKWLSGPSNMTIRSASRLLLAAEADLDVAVVSWHQIRASLQMSRMATNPNAFVVDLEVTSEIRVAGRNAAGSSWVLADVLQSQAHGRMVPASPALVEKGADKTLVVSDD